MTRVRFDTINLETGKQETYIGKFKNEGEASKWYDLHGSWFEKRGRKLIKVLF